VDYGASMFQKIKKIAEMWILDSYSFYPFTNKSENRELEDPASMFPI
jgi:hypothetical protein